ncbi:acyl-CoA thioesterase II [Myceligenerans sp. I2]|uniref:Acyl-CoA thioesterase II n=2 Tax=Myceligenerans indicum TaxID=2593663 RepID=A0ABS1LLQ6_9MICO|nr:acyl-CoA thioesterase II [Myceligenerans indicum]
MTTPDGDGTTSPDTTPPGTAAPGTTPPAEEPDPLGHLLEVLDLRPVDGPGPRGEDDVFEGDSVLGPAPRAYGGQVLAQAIIAAARTVPPGRLIHSLHGYFLREGSLEAPIGFAVERLRDGRSFSARRSHAMQFGRPILSMIASFQEEQPGFELTTPMPDGVPAPGDVPSAVEELEGADDRARTFWAEQSAFDLRHVGGSLYLPRDPSAGEPAHTQLVWMKARRPIGSDDQMLHRAMLAFACDQIMLEPALRAAGRSWQEVGGGKVPLASLDHAMWWHRDVRADEWLLYVQGAASAQGGRALGHARVYKQDGTLVASMGQEGMMRLPG